MTLPNLKSTDDRAFTSEPLIQASDETLEGVLYGSAQMMVRKGRRNAENILKELAKQRETLLGNLTSDELLQLKDCQEDGLGLPGVLQSTLDELHRIVLAEVWVERKLMEMDRFGREVGIGQSRGFDQIFEQAQQRFEI